MHFGVVLNLLRRAVLQHAAVVHHRDALGHAERDVEIVLDQHEAQMARQRAQQCDEFAPLGGRQSGRRLVEQDQSRRAGQCHPDFELPLLPMRQRSDRCVSNGIEAHLVQQGFGRDHARVRSAAADAC